MATDDPTERQLREICDERGTLMDDLAELSRLRSGYSDPDQLELPWRDESDEGTDASE